MVDTVVVQRGVGYPASSQRRLRLALGFARRAGHHVLAITFLLPLMWFGALENASASLPAAGPSVPTCERFFRRVAAELAKSKDPDQQVLIRYRAVLETPENCKSVGQFRSAVTATSGAADVEPSIESLRVSCSLSISSLSTQFQNVFSSSELLRFRNSKLCREARALPGKALPAGVQQLDIPLFFERGTLDVAVGDDAIWVTLNSGATEVVRVDPTTLRVAARLKLAQKEPKRKPVEGAHVEVGEGAVWVFDQNTLWRVDPATNRVAATIRTDKGLGDPRSLTVGGGYVWITENFEIYRIDPATNRKLRFSSAVVTDSLAWASGSLWALDDSDLVRLGPQDGQVSARIAVSVNTNAKLTFSEGSLWVLNARGPDREPGSLLRVDPVSGAVTARSAVGWLSDDVLAIAGAAWVSSGQEGVLTSIDPSTNAVIETLKFPGGTRLAYDGQVLWTTGPHALFRCQCG